MKRIWLILAVLSLVLLCACDSLLPKDDLSVAEHDDPFAYKEETQSSEPEEETEPPLPSAGNYYAMRSILQDFVNQGVEHGQFLLEHYDGDVDQDLRRVVKYLTKEDPVVAYATDYLYCERYPYHEGWLVSVDAIFRRSVSEIQSILPVRGNEAAMEKLLDAMTQLQGSMTLRISGYLQEDLSEKLLAYCMEHPETMVEIPQIAVSVYPDSGNVRVVEVHFTFDQDRETIRTMRQESNNILDSAYNFIRYAPTPQEKLSMLNDYLTGRFPYTEDPEATVYSLLCQGTCDSRSYAAVTRYLCEKTDIDCQIVSGSRGELPYWWNMICVDGLYYHVDLQRDNLEQNEVTLRLDSDMEGYVWDRERYPVCDGVAEPETEPTQTP